MRNPQLNQMDSLLTEYPRLVMDSLKAMDASNFSSSDRAYYHLLYTIAEDKTGKDFENDSLISLAAKWYSGSRDYHNYARSMLYKGIILYRINREDTCVYTHIKKAEEICDDYQINDHVLQGFIYSFLGVINHNVGNYELADRNYREAVIHYQTAGDSLNARITRINLIWNLVARKQYGEADVELKKIEKTPSLPLTTQFDLINIYASISSRLDDYNTSLIYWQKLLILSDSLKLDKISIYYSISKNYRKLHDYDSSFFYAQEVIRHIQSSSSLDYLYYLNYAEAAQEIGAYKIATENYSIAYRLQEQQINRLSEKRILDLEKRYDQVQITEKLTQTQKRAWMSIAIGAALLLIISWLCWLIFHKLVKQKYQNREDILLSRIYKGFMQGSSDIEITLDSIAQKYQKDKIFYDEIQQAIKQIRGNTQMKIFDNIESLLPPDVEKLVKKNSNLTREEIILCILCDLSWSSKDIACLLHTTDGNIRTKKSQLKRKIEK